MSNIIDIYLCKTDFDYHIPDDVNGVNIYFSEKAIHKCRECVKYCGVVKLKLDLDTMEIVSKPQKEDYDIQD